MRRTAGLSSALVFALSAIACGERAEEAETEAPADAGAPTTTATAATDWVHGDDAAKTVMMDVVSGKDATNNNWNFNGFANGNATVTVPVGYTVTINFSNNDPNMAHSIGVSEKPAGPWSATPATTPVFAGAISSNPTSMTDATTQGETETITFTADRAGQYALVCYVPGHATAGMWINFTVTEGGAAGVTAGMGGAPAAPAATGGTGTTGATGTTGN
jgi:sulfocyanin